MDAVTAPDVSLLNACHMELRILAEHPVNALLEGSVAATDAVLRVLFPYRRDLIVRRRAEGPFQAPDGGPRSLILDDAAALDRDDQRRLLAWMAGAGSRTQIISVTEQSLFPLVADGRFSPALYYQLNVVLVQVDVEFSTLPTRLRGREATR